MAGILEFEASVKRFFDLEGVTSLSILEGDDNQEPYFSWRPCECCGSRLGGDRYDTNGYNPETKEIYEYTVCNDCILYIYNGDLPDTWE